jgi:hypothetical protein
MFRGRIDGKAAAVGEYVFLWLELNGFRRVSKAIQYVAVSYTTLIVGGLALAIVLNLAALGLNELNMRAGHIPPGFNPG